MAQAGAGRCAGALRQRSRASGFARRHLRTGQLGPRKEQIDALRGQSEQAKGTLDYAQTQLDNTVIRAPVTRHHSRAQRREGRVRHHRLRRRPRRQGLRRLAGRPERSAKWNSTSTRTISPSSARGRRASSPPMPIPTASTTGMIDEISPEANRQKATVQVKVKVLEPGRVSAAGDERERRVLLAGRSLAATHSEPRRSRWSRSGFGGARWRGVRGRRRQGRAARP